jgi:sugar transferase (PEP-CTERM system associated)
VKVNVNVNSILVLLFGDFLLALCAVYTGFFIRSGMAPLDGAVSQVKMEQLPFFVIGVMFSSFMVELYDGNKNLNTKERAVWVLIGLVVSFTILSALYYLLPDVTIGRGSFVLSLGAFGVFQFLWHVVYVAFINSDRLAKKVLVLGTGLTAQKIGGLIQATNHQHVLRGYFSCDHGSISVPLQDIVGSSGACLMEVVRQEKLEKIVVSLSERRGTLPVRDILSCKLSGIEVVDAPSFYEQMTGKLFLEDLRPSWLIFSDGFRMRSAMRLYTRFFDITASSIGLLITLPVLPLLALTIKLDSKGPVFFKQTRVGMREKLFELIKFRTMRQDAESETGAVWAQKDDQRVTRVGKVLRKVRLDELPQLWNVLKGDMSLIGPRPERPEFVEKLKKIIPFYSERHFLKPGITGWAQIKYPYGASVEDAIEKLKFDLYYIKNVSPMLDLLITLETLKVVLFGRGGR